MSMFDYDPGPIGAVRRALKKPTTGSISGDWTHTGFLKKDVDPFFMAGGSLANKNLRTLIERGISAPRQYTTTYRQLRPHAKFIAGSSDPRQGPALEEYSDVRPEAVTGAQQAFMRRIEDIARQRRQPGRKQSIITK